MKQVEQKLKEKNIGFLKDVDLKSFTYLKTGGTSKLILFPKNTNEMVAVLNILNQEEVTFKVIGASSNLLFLDDVEYGCLVSTAELKGVAYKESSKEIIVGSGIMLPDLARIALFHSVKGFEGLEGIPGTVGGAVYMNAGAYGYEIKEVLKYVEAVDFNANVIRFQVDDLQLKKRSSALRRKEMNVIITKICFKAELGDPTDIEGKMEIYHAKRHKYQDFQYPSLGSIFSGSIYRALGKNDKYTYLMSSLFYLLNYKLKIFRRESPINRKWINDLIVKRFKLHYKIQPFSNKTMNCLVNRGQGTKEMVRYIREIEDLTGKSVPLENEIVEPF